MRYSAVLLLLSFTSTVRAQDETVNDAPAQLAPVARAAPAVVAVAAGALLDSPRPPLAHGKSSVELLKSGRADLSAQPAGSARDAVLGALSDLEDGASRVAPDQRQGWIDAHLGGFNASVRGLDAGAPTALALASAREAAMLNGRAERWAESRNFADRALGQNPNDLISLVVRARADVGLQEYAQAYADAARAARLDPQMASAFAARAAAEYGLGRFKSAQNDARHALTLDPLDATAFDLMKLAQARAGLVAPDFGPAPSPDAAEREYHGMLQQLSQVERRRKNPDETVRAPDVARLNESAGEKLSIRDYRGAVSEADKALAQDPTDALALYYRSAAHNLLGDYAVAVQDATKGLLVRPDDAPLLDARSWAFDRLGRLDDAVADAHRALEADPGDGYALANRAYADEQRRDFAAMLEDYRAATRLDPRFTDDYAAAARRHGLATGDAPDGAAPPAPAAPSHGREFGAVLLSSLAGGLLIALGLLHVGSAAREERAKTRGPVGLESSYELGRPIGQGGMGVVYRAFDRNLKRAVAIKTLRDEFKLDESAKAGFLEEARTVAELRHPAIVEIYAIVEDERGIALVFELLEGRPLDEAIAERGRLSVAEIKRVLKPVCAALEYAHSHGVVHRDLKPSNVMLLVDGSVKVLDFGISRHAAGATRKAVTQSVVGTPHYMAPEQEYGVVRRESDIFSLGAVLYEATTGARPFEGSAAVKLARGYRRASNRAPGLPPALDALIDRALEPDPDKRIESVAQFWDALSAIPDAA